MCCKTSSLSASKNVCGNQPQRYDDDVDVDDVNDDDNDDDDVL
jgi:hypothetical protein